MYVIRMRTIIIATIIGILSTCVIVYGIAHSSGEENNIRIVEPVSATESIELPIMMYHGLTEKSSQVGTYVIPTTAFESDLKYLKDNGYETVLLRDVVEYVDGNADLPEKPIVLTFDDGFRNNLLYALPLLEKYDMKAVISTVGIDNEKFASVDDKNPDYAYLDWDEINELIDSGRIEIGNHSYNMHKLAGDKGNTRGTKGIDKKNSESEEDYKTVLINDVGKNQDLLKQHANIEPKVFAYPFGSLNKYSENILKDMGFRVTLSCMQKPNYISQNNPDSLYCLCRYLRSDKKSVADILNSSTKN